MGPGGLLLRRMDEARYRAYIEKTIPAYAAEGARATGVSSEDALAYAREQFASILPRGPSTPGQHLCQVMDAAGKEVGVLWYAARLERTPRRVFLYDIVIDPALRGRGFGAAAMVLFENAARELGADEVALHVFAHNEVAIRLYEHLGYRSAGRGQGGMQMVKTLRGVPEPEVGDRDGAPRADGVG